MFSTRKLVAALVATAGLSLTLTPAFAMDSMKSDHSMMKSRFSGPGVYTGAPQLKTTLSMIIAGGGPAKFDTVKLVTVLAGAKTKAEVASLTKRFGGSNVKSFLTVFDYVVNDSLKIVTAKKVALPSKPDPSPTNGKALAAALWKLGVQPDGNYNVEVMLDELVSHPIHVQVMKDIDAKYGVKADANYHIVLNAAMHDLKSVYGL